MLDHISASQINSFVNCQAKWMFRYHPDFNLITPPGGALTRGKAVHKGIEKNYKQKVTSERDLPLEEVLAACAEEHDLLAPDTVWGEDDPGKMKDSAIALTKVYHENIAPTVQPVGVEEEIRIKIPRVKPVLLGYIDVRQRGGIIRDTKTSSKAPREDVIRNSIQLSAYDYAHRVITGCPAESLKLDYLVSTQKPYVKTLEGYREECDIERFLYVVRRAVAAMQLVLKDWRKWVQLADPQTYFLCSPKWCGYYDRCHKIFREKVSGKKVLTKELEAAIRLEEEAGF